MISVVAVALGAAFLVAPFLVAARLGAALDERARDLVAEIDLVVEAGARPDVPGQGSGEGRIPPELVASVRAVSGVRSAEVRSSASVFLADDAGRVRDVPLTLEVADGLAVGPYRVVSGRAPAAADEFVLLTDTAERLGLGLGATLRTVTPSGVRDATVVGLARVGLTNRTLGIDVVLSTVAGAERWTGADVPIQRLALDVDAGADTADVARLIEGLAPGRVHVNDAGEARLAVTSDVFDEYRVLLIGLAGFAGITLVVCSMLVANTFNISVTQRSRELALMRTIGATRSQVFRLVLVEALLVGVVSSVVGLVIGTGFANGMLLMADRVGLVIEADARPGPFTTVLVIVVGVLLPLVAVLLPAARATRVSPMVALARVDSTTDAARWGAGPLLGAFGVVIGALLLIRLAGMDISGSGVVGVLFIGGLGATALLAGLALLARVIVGPVISVFAWPLGWRGGPMGRLAASTAVRSPRRTAATATALMVGIALITMFSVVLSSVAARADEIVGSLGARWDLVIDDVTKGVGLPEDVRRSAMQVPGVAAAGALRQSSGQLEVVGADDIPPTDAPVHSIETAQLDRLLDVRLVSGRMPTEPGEALLDEEYARVLAVSAGSRLRVRTSASTGATAEPTEVEITGILAAEDNVVPGLLVDAAATPGPTADASTELALVRVASDASIDAVAERLREQFTGLPQVRVRDRDALAASITSVLTTARNLVVGMLVVAVAVAALGIVNTTLLSLLERTREIGMMRAVGMTAVDLRFMIVGEATLTAVFGGALGLAAGASVGAAVSSAIGGPVSLPIMVMVMTVVGSTLLGVVASILPARRAARMGVGEVLGAV